MKGIKGLLYIALLLISPELFAGVFDPPPTDKSVALLGVIFGSNIGNLYLGGAANPILSQIMEKFNFIIVVVGTVIVSYVGIMATINTAQEGTAMGKKWSAVWIPMRSVAGMALMIPSPASGYSMIQVTVMWIVLQGIGAADQIWGIVLDGLSHGANIAAQNMGSQTPIKFDINNPTEQSKLVQQVLEAAICMEAYKAFSTQPNHTMGISAGSDWLRKNASFIKNWSKVDTIQDSKDPTSKCPSVKVSGHSYFGLNNPTAPDADQAACGRFLVTGSVEASEFTGSACSTCEKDKDNAGKENCNCSNEANCPTNEDLTKAAQLIYDTKLLAISSMLTVLQPLAQAIVKNPVMAWNSQGKYALVAQAPKAPPDPTSSTLFAPGYFDMALNAYTQVLSGLIVPIGITTNPALNKAIQSGIKAGWVSAGSYYFVFNKAQSPHPFKDTRIPKIDSVETLYTLDNCTGCVDHATTHDKAFDSGTLSRYSIDDNDLISLTQFVGYATDYIKSDSTTVASDLGFDASGLSGASDSMSIANGLTSQILHSFTQTMNGAQGTDPLLAHSQFGHSMMIGAEATLITILVLPNVALIAAAFLDSTMIFGNGQTGTAILMIADALMEVAAVILPFLGALWTVGASLAIYTPLIPYMIFTMAVLGWLLTVVEAVIAAPLIALGLVVPSGDELGKLEHALMLLANIFLRPMLMIFGFLLAGRVYNAIVQLVDFGMMDVFNTINVNTMFSIVVIIALYATFIIGLTNTAFSLIYAVPDKVLRWMGGPAEHTDTAAMGQAKEGAGAAGKAGGENMGEVGKAAHGAGKSKIGAGLENRAGDIQAAKDSRQAAKEKKINKGGGERGEGQSGPSRPDGSF
jgi:conjugal transfer/type IV secretion protein DotA/TraY